MSLRSEPSIVEGLYRLPEDPIGPAILVPGFRQATSVRGAFGWFTAGWISRLAPGLADYLNRPDTRQIDFTISPSLYPAERSVLESTRAITPEDAMELVVDVFESGRATASALGQHALACLAWMVATDRLLLSIAIPTPESNYHPKVWLFDDGRDQLLVRGSANATGRGLQAGVEHMDVDVSWGNSDRVRSGMQILDDWSNGRSEGIARVLPLEEAFKERVILTAPGTPPTTEEYQAALEADAVAAVTADTARLLRQRFRGGRVTPQRLSIPQGLVWEDGRYGHQGEAVHAWERSPTPGRGTISMATGAGKTITALICATRVQDSELPKGLLVLVSAPSVPLMMQWRDEVKDFGVHAIAPSLDRGVEESLTRLFRQLSAASTEVLIVSNTMLCTPGFQHTLKTRLSQLTETVDTLFIGDEAHTLGAQGFVSRKPEFLHRRIALSATPVRQYDPDGTEEIFAFFGDPVYEFGLDRAIGFCLVPYDYFVHAAALDGEELESYERLTARIGVLLGGQSDPDFEDEHLQQALIARRRIIETAGAKIELLRRVLELRVPRDISHALIYASAKNPAQFEAIGEVLTDLNIRWAPVTEATTADRTLLSRSLQAFREGGFQVLLAKKVLDEGIDIPAIREAFIVASSTVEREWVQRRGRVLRMSEGKSRASVHDFVALPPAAGFRSRSTATERRIVRTELERAYAFAAYADNATGENGVLAQVNALRESYWGASSTSGVLQGPGELSVAPGVQAGNLW